MRNKYVTRKNNEENVPDFLEATPKDIRASACFDLEAAFKAAFSNLKNCNIPHFNMGYKTKKSGNSFGIPKTALTIDKKSRKIIIYKRALGLSVRYSKDKKFKDLKEFGSDIRLFCKNKAWFILVPYKKKEIDLSEKNKTIALDPGVMTFQTGYSKDEVIKFQQSDKINILNNKKDKLHSLAKNKKIKYSSYRNSEKRINLRISNLIDDLHYKTIAHLQCHYDNILLPSFDSQEMVKKSKARKTNRMMLNLEHFKFKERLIEKCKNKKCDVRIVSEAFTSKTCTSCGHIKENLKCSVREIKCNNCSKTIDRDINGARNIYLKNFSLC